MPVFGVEFFFTGDGPAHLYNSSIIAQLLLEEQPAIAAFFELRTTLIPNAGGHALLTIFNLLLPAPLAEKLVYGMCLLLLPVAFRYVLKKLNPEALAFSLLIFPLAHNFCFYIGFQSFCIGLALLFFSVGYFISVYNRLNLRNGAGLAALLFLTAFFHLFTALVALMVILIYSAVKASKSGLPSMKSIFFTVLAVLPTVVFCGYFVVSNSTGFKLNGLSFYDQVTQILIATPLITLDTSETWIAITFNVLLLAGIIRVLLVRVRNKTIFSTVDFALISAASLLVLFFLLPDKMASGGFVSMRILLCFFLFLTLWVALVLDHSFVAIAISFFVVLLNGIMFNLHVHEARKLSHEAAIVYEAAQYIPEESKVVPMNYSAHWLHYNIGLYLGAERKLIVLDNYEASTAHFPVYWKRGMYPDDRLGNFTTSLRPLLKLEPYESNTGQRIDAVVRWSYHSNISDSLTLLTNALLATEFEKVYVSENNEVEVHLRKSN